MDVFFRGGSKGTIGDNVGANVVVFAPVNFLLFFSVGQRNYMTSGLYYEGNVFLIAPNFAFHTTLSLTKLYLDGNTLIIPGQGDFG
jgi:hypothetical protein